MGVYIKGMEMPTERESFNLTIKYNGVVLDTETGTQVAEAHELPPHGDLIDRDPFIEFIKTHWDGYDQWFVGQLEARPTIIPAEEGET